MIAGLTPEQVLTIRPVFERKMAHQWATSDAYAPTPEEAEKVYRDNLFFSLKEDGFGYKDKQVDYAWEGFIMGYAHYKLDSEEFQDKVDSGVHEDLRRMRQYSKCFTTAYDRKQPVFVLIPQDETAWKALAQWIVSNIPHLGDNHPKIVSAKATLGIFRDWPNKKKAD